MITITLSDALDGVKAARDYWDTQWAAAYAAGDQDGLDAAMAEQRGLSRLVTGLICVKEQHLSHG